MRRWALSEHTYQCGISGKTALPPNRPPRIYYRGQAARETNEFDGVLYINESVKLDKNGTFAGYVLRAEYVPDPDDETYNQSIEMYGTAAERMVADARDIVCKGLGIKMPYEKVDVIDDNER